MGKKYKSKSMGNQKKKVASKEGPETAKAKKSNVGDAKTIRQKDEPLTVTTENAEPSVVTKEETDKHLEQVAAIAIMPLRLDQQIQGIKAIQKQLLELHRQQVMMLEDCTNLLQELNTIEPRNDMEAKLVVDTFVEVKDKLSDVFGHFLPAQLDILKQVLGKSKEVKPN